MSSTVAALPYHEPSIVTILILSSFLLLLNFLNALLNNLLSCGLIGQILLGVAWGLPGAQWLSLPAQETITQLGYLGLILLIYEGGLATSIPALRAYLWLSIGVAVTGILLPIALSFMLMGLAGATALQAFAAGAALCSTSLGTTFSLLSSSGLVSSPLGVVLSSATMLDDVVGLVMVQIISNLGSEAKVGAVTVLRPVLVSLAFATIIPAVCILLIRPVLRLSNHGQKSWRPGWLERALPPRSVAIVLQMSVLIGFVTGASYAGASNLFSAYLAGVFIKWCSAEPGLSEDGAKVSDGETIYHDFLSASVSRILQPFFFASIGFSIPLRLMFTPPIIWRSVVYSVLMILGKLVCGLCLLRPLRQSLPLSMTTKREENVAAQSANTESETAQPLTHKRKSTDLYSASILGFAMVARGEIGFLIAAIAEARGIFKNASARDGSTSRGASELYLVVCWAVLVCTVVGPLGVGIVVGNGRSKSGKEQERTRDGWT